MLETLLAMALWSAIPDILFAPVAIAGVAFLDDVNQTVDAQKAIDDDCVIYVKDYTDCKPEWFWGDQKGYFNFHEFMGYSPEQIQRDIITKGLHKIEKGSSVPKDDYTLRLYFRQNVCIKAEYWRPLDKQFLACYGHGDDASFHVYSEHFGKDYPIDLVISYYNLLNAILYDKGPQMCITVGMCPNVMPDVSLSHCYCREYKN